MDKKIAAALADELLTTVIHKMQIPGSNVQLVLQGEAVKQLSGKLSEVVKFDKDLDLLVDDVVAKMPACFGMVPKVFYHLRHAVEKALCQDPLLKCVVRAHSVHGDQSQLELVSILRRPDVPQELKDELMDQGIFIAPSSDMLDSVTTIIKELSDDVEKDLLRIASSVSAAQEGDELSAAVAELVADGNPERLANAPCDIVGAMELSAKCDQILYHLYRRHLHRYYDKGEV